MTITAEPTTAPTTDENPQVIVKELANHMFAYRAGTGTVLAEATRKGFRKDDEYIGWAVVAPCRKTELVDSRLLAKHILTEYATDAIGAQCAVGYQLVLRDRHDTAVRVELTFDDEVRSYAEVRELMLRLERLFPIVHDLRTRYLAVEPVRAAR